MFKQKWYFAVFLVLALSLSACQPTTTSSSTPNPQPTTSNVESKPSQPTNTNPPDQPTVVPTKSGPSVARIGWAGSPDTLNPNAAMLTESFSIFGLVYNTLVSYQLDGTYKLDLADSFTKSDDGKVYTYKINPNAKFHDGTPLTAKDVAFSFNLYMSHEDFPYMNGYTKSFEKVEAVDDTTFKLTLKEPSPNLDSQLFSLYILPEHIWKDHTEGKAATEFPNTEMIGSGPFKLKKYAQGEYVDLAANRDYFRTGPKVDEVVFQTFANKDALVQAIKTGQVDMITEMPNTAVVGLKSAPNVRVVTGAPLAPDVTDIIFNQTGPDNCPKDAGGKCTGHPALRDQKVREALAYATNKKEMIDIVLLGLGAPGLTLIPDSLGAWYNNSIQDRPFDIAKANQILDDAGYKDINGDGVREMPDGTHPLNFRLNYPSDSTVAPRTAELLSKYWGQIGVKLQLQAVDANTLSSICCPTFDYDILIWGWGSDPDPDFLLRVMLTENIPTGTSETGYSNKAYDDLFAQETKEMNPQTRKDLVWKMQDVVFNDVVYIVPFYAKAVQAYRTDRFKGWITDQPKLALENLDSLMVIEPVQ